MDFHLSQKPSLQGSAPALQTRWRKIGWFALLLCVVCFGCRNQRFTVDDLETQLHQPTAQLHPKSISQLRSLLRGRTRPRRQPRQNGGPPSFHTQLRRFGIPEGILHRVTAFSLLSDDFKRLSLTLRTPRSAQDKDIFNFPLHPCYDVQKTRRGYRLTLQLSCTSEGSGVLIVSLHGKATPKTSVEEVVWRYLSACDRQRACLSGRMTMRIRPSARPCSPKQTDDICAKDPETLHTLTLVYHLTRKRAKRRSAQLRRGGFRLRYRLLLPIGQLEHLLFLRKQQRITQESFVLRYNPLQRITRFELQGANGRFLCERRDDNMGSCRPAK